MDQEGEERKGRFFDRFVEENPYALDVLKGHLLVEEVLEEIIASACQDSQPLYEARLTFFAKTKLAQAIDGKPSPLWDCVGKLNSVRNELAHGRDQTVLEDKIDLFIGVVRQGYGRESWRDDRAFNLGLAIVITHAAVSRVAAGRGHA